MQSLIIDYAVRLYELASKIDYSNLKNIQSLIYQKDRTIFILGNGGSQANAGHLALHLMEKGIRVINILDNPCAISALSNDFSYEKAPAIMLENQGRKGDILLVITGSGKSANIILALTKARTLKMTTIGFLGMDGGDAIGLCDYHILIANSDYALIEDLHSIIIHLLGKI